MAIEIKESGPSEDEVESMIGRGRVRVEEVQIEEGKFGQQIRLDLLHRNGSSFRAWVTPNRTKIEEVCRCFGVKPPARGETFEEASLVGKVGEVRLSTKVDAKGTTRPKVDAWLAAAPGAKPIAALAKEDEGDGEGLPF